MDRTGLRKQLNDQLEKIGREHGQQWQDFFSVEMGETLFFLDGSTPVSDERIADALRLDISQLEKQLGKTESQYKPLFRKVLGQYKAIAAPYLEG